LIINRVNISRIYTFFDIALKFSLWFQICNNLFSTSCLNSNNIPQFQMVSCHYLLRSDHSFYHLMVKHGQGC
jgi:hypothetical protein